MPEKQAVLMTVKNGIAKVVLNRPEKLNALNEHIFKRLDEIFLRLKKDTSLTGKKINASQALKYGLINEICPREDISNTVKKITDTLVKKSLEAMKKIIACINFSSGLTSEHMDFERGAFTELLQSDTAQKSVKRFLKK